MKGFCFPVILGCYEKADKCGVIFKHPKVGGYSLVICRMKHQTDRGAEVEEENVGHPICHLHFCKLEAAQDFLKSVNMLVEAFEKEESEK